MTYLLTDANDGRNGRSLVTLPRKDLEKTEITGYDPILRILFAHPARRGSSAGGGHQG